MGTIHHERVGEREDGLSVDRGFARADVLEFRARRVVDHGWYSEPHHDDRDRYDADPSTWHLATYDDAGVQATMRLTQVKDPTQLLSLEMLGANPAMQLTAAEGLDRLSEAAVDGRLWDQTRLLTRGDNAMSDLKAMFALFGGGVGLTERPNADIVWAFTITDEMKSVLERSGLAPEIIVSGQLDDGADRSVGRCHFGYVEARSSVENLLKGGETDRFVGFVADLVERGIKRIRSSQERSA